MSLVDRLRTRLRDTRGRVLLGWIPTGYPPQARGITIDGVTYPLDGQPPVARSKGWGDLPGGRT
ncbi:hypothetical protein [Micromonospora aurantiaca (nom. illeg.)]|uniref:hypothetical protein n=1 Tax=Micromonospora aurantiaca (nom. illeg.) TaxID=47850 RepID=UPI003F4A78FE